MLHRQAKFDIVHARTFVGGLIGRSVARGINGKLVYHNEGFYSREQVDAGAWKQGSRLHKLGERLEKWLNRSASGAIVLSEYAASEIREHWNPECPIRVIPSCVDLEHFSGRPTGRKVEQSDGFRLVYLGSIGGRYDFPRMAAFAAKLISRYPGSHFSVFTSRETELARAHAIEAGIDNSDFTVRSIPHARVPIELGQQDLAIHCLKPGISEHGGSPTKLGEYWAMGLPVVTTVKNGDSDSIIKAHQVGVTLPRPARIRYWQCAR